MSRDAILSALASPDRAWIVLLAGIVMIYREFMAPGRVLPGIAGGIAVCVGSYALFQHPWRMDALSAMLAGVALVILQGFRRWYWLPSALAAALITIGARRLTEPAISFGPAAAAIPLSLISGFLLHTALAARRRKRSV
jgi:membrane-bound serine protease (ClpP class)